MSNSLDRKERREDEVKKVDDLIIELAGHINDLIKNGGECEHEIAEKTKALLPRFLTNRMKSHGQE